ncbi:MAG TPA: SoxY-related AACIE arm protein [Xanthobacteraceae bacterium]|jgi:sulfur-oxidizing protein SoxY|nr:SoxY-related AACIE arm protein [Xanthobacteraceae bacterium]
MKQRPQDRTEQMGATRRDFLERTACLASGIAFMSVAATRSSRATPETMTAAIRKTVGEAPIRKGKVMIDVPPLVENGNTVPVSVSVDSPMTASDYVKSIHLFNEKNPQPYLIDAYFSPRSGKAALSTRIKLADAQKIVAVAQLSDGSFWSDEADVIVTIAACVEDLQ